MLKNEPKDRCPFVEEGRRFVFFAGRRGGSVFWQVERGCSHRRATALSDYLRSNGCLQLFAGNRHRSRGGSAGRSLRALKARMLRSFASCCSRSHACAGRSPPPPAADGKSRVARCPPAAVGEQAGSTSQTSAARSRPLAEGCFSRRLVAVPSARLRAETESCVARQRGGPQLPCAEGPQCLPFPPQALSRTSLRDSAAGRSLRVLKARNAYRALRRFQAERVRATARRAAASPREGPHVAPFASCCPCEDRTKAGAVCRRLTRQRGKPRGGRPMPSANLSQHLATSRINPLRNPFPDRLPHLTPPKKRGPLQERAPFRCVFATAAPTPCRRTPSDIP